MEGLEKKSKEATGESREFDPFEQLRQEVKSHPLVVHLYEAAVEVSRAMGIGRLEIIYENTLMAALRERHLRCIQQEHVDFLFHGEHVASGRLDFALSSDVDNHRECVLVELKVAVPGKSGASGKQVNAAVRQLTQYLDATRRPLGVVLNFSKTTYALHFAGTCSQQWICDRLDAKAGVDNNTRLLREWLKQYPSTVRFVFLLPAVQVPPECRVVYEPRKFSPPKVVSDKTAVTNKKRNRTASEKKSASVKQARLETSQPPTPDVSTQPSQPLAAHTQASTATNLQMSLDPL